MIETTHVWEVDVTGVEYSARRAMQKKYGSRKSGTIYLIGSNQAEAKEVARDLFRQAGLTPPASPLVFPTHLVKNALRLIP